MSRVAKARRQPAFLDADTSVRIMEVQAAVLDGARGKSLLAQAPNAGELAMSEKERRRVYLRKATDNDLMAEVINRASEDEVWKRRLMDKLKALPGKKGGYSEPRLDLFLQDALPMVQERLRIEGKRHSKLAAAELLVSYISVFKDRSPEWLVKKYLKGRRPGK